MTLLNHIGVLAILFLFELVVIIGFKSVRDDLKIKTAKDMIPRIFVEPFIMWAVLEAFYWTFKIFF